MKNFRFAILCLGIVCSLGFLWSTSLSLPQTLASHFNWAGQADGFMSRTGYLILYALMMLAMPLFIYAMAGLFPAYLARHADASLSIPHRQYWLAAERRAASADYLQNHAVWLAIIVLGLFDAIHFKVWQANQHVSLAQAQADFTWMLILSVLAILLWIGTMLRHFWQLPAQPAQ